MRDRRVPRSRYLGPLRTWADRRRRDERGATLVEAAFVMPVFILMIFGIFEFSGNIMARSGTSSAVKAGARMAAVVGQQPLADREILLQMANGSVGIAQDHIDKIVIWRVNDTSNPGPGGYLRTPPASCSPTGAHPCNIYLDPQNAKHAFDWARKPTAPTGVDPDSSSNYTGYRFGCNTGSGSDTGDSDNEFDCGWEPNTRRIMEKSPAYTCSGTNDPKCAPSDVVGIYMQVTHDSYTGFFGSSMTVDAQTIVPIEPKGYDE